MSSYSIVWVVIALVFGTIEVLVTSFAFLLAGMSALVAALLSALHAPFEIQVIAFAVTMVLSLIFVRPILKDKFKRTAGLPGRAEPPRFGTGVLGGELLAVLLQMFESRCPPPGSN